MKRKDFYLIPVLAAVILIPQLMFWWLAPVSASAFLTAYIAGTTLTFAIPLTCFLIYFRPNIRRTAGLFLVCGGLDLAVIALIALLLGVNATVRTAVFSFLILTLIDLILLLPFVSGILKTQPQGIRPVDELIEITGDFADGRRNSVRESQRLEGTTGRPVRDRTVRKGPDVTPLPPRKH